MTGSAPQACAAKDAVDLLAESVTKLAERSALEALDEEVGKLREQQEGATGTLSELSQNYAGKVALPADRACVIIM